MDEPERKALALWCRDRLKPRAISRPSLLIELIEHGVAVTFAGPQGEREGLVELARHARQARLPLRRWQDAFRELRDDGSAFLVNAAVDHDIEVPTDDDGAPGYHVVAEPPEHLPFASLTDDGSTFVIYDDEVLEAVVGLLLDDDPGIDFLGRGRRFEARLDALLARRDTA